MILQHVNLYNEVAEVSSENIEYFSTYNHNVMQYMHMCLHISYMITPIFIGSKVDELMAYYREFFPMASVIPKLHMLEDHMVHDMDETMARHSGVAFRTRP